MDLEKLAEKIRDIVLGEIKEEFREFRASVTGELSGFRIALESINARQTNLENELRDIRRAIDETNKRIDETNKRIDETNKRIDETNKRIDETNKRIDVVQSDMIARFDMVNMKFDETNKKIDNVRDYLLARLDETNKRIDETNKRIDTLYLEVSEMRGDLKKAISDKEIIHDMIFRIERLESKIAA